MTPAYDEAYLEGARRVLGSMCEEAVYAYGCDADEFLGLFVSTGLGEAFGRGDVRLVAGMSGAELAAAVLSRSRRSQNRVEFEPPLAYSREWWAGWSLATYQWERSLSFAEIVHAVPFSRIVSFYDPYHEMDITAFVARMDELWRDAHPTTALAQRRRAVDLSQSQLAAASGVSVRSIQQYEQRAKDINQAAASTLSALAQVLCCSTDDLLERVPWVGARA